MELNFKPSAPLTLGLELEWQILDPKTMKLKGHSAELLQALKEHNPELAKHFKPEVVSSMVEMNSGVHESPASLLEELYALRTNVQEVLPKLNLGLAGGGTHPSDLWTNRKIYPQKNYLDLHKVYGFLFKQISVYGLHIHLGCASKEAALYLIHAMAPYIPHFIALSASSPFYTGVDTFFDCSRLTTLSAFPMSGTMPFFTEWEQFEVYFNHLTKSKVVTQPRNLYWDIRPNIDYGTIEIRVCDTPLTLKRAAALAAYAQALAAFLLAHRVPLSEDCYIPYRYNRFAAMRYGLNAYVIDVNQDEQQPLHEEILRSLEKVKPYAQKLGSEFLLADLETICHSKNNDAQLLQAVYQESKCFKSVSQKAMDLW